MTILITAGTGKTGSRIATRLAALDLPHRVGSRSGAPGTTRFDWDDTSTWEPALEGAGAAYIAFVPDLAFPGAVDVLGGFVDRAVEAGVSRLVLLSGRGEESARAAEERVAASGLDFTVVRSAFFMQNFSESFFLEPLRAGVLALPAGDVTEPFVDADDIADVAVAALIESGHEGQIYELTGPELLGFADIVDRISTAAGRPIAYVPITSSEYVDGLVANGVPEDVAHGLSALFSEVLDGRNSHTSDGVVRALGRRPTSFDEFAQKVAGSGVWSS